MNNDRTGTRLGPYHLEKLLGEGGMGQVYEARDEKLGRTVAVKILRPEVVADKEHRDRFEREAKALAALKHPGIVTIYAFEEVDDITFFVMDLVDGRPLTDIIKEDGGLPVERILDLAIPIADAVAAAHKRGIAHRDLKPDNIIVGPRDEVTVLDFGLAKKGGMQFSGGDPDVTAPTMHVTLEGRIFGTVNYMAPEQADAGETNLATDVFSLGVVIYEMATGELPFKGDTAMSILSSILKDRPIAMATYDKEVPHELEALVHRCLEKDPDRRWQSALDVRNELEIVRDRIRNAPAATTTRDEAALETSVPPGAGGRLGWMVATGAFAAVAGILLTLLLARPGTTPPAATSATTVEPIWTFDSLTSDPGKEDHPTLSPDGDFIAFSMRSSDDEEETSIYLLGVDGTRPIEVTADMPGFESSPRFSPDGKQIAFRSQTLDAKGNLHVMRTTGGFRRSIGVDGHAPDWSPDGRSLVYSTTGYFQPHGRPVAGALRIVDIETGDDREIHPGDAVDPRWSPDGEWILFWTVGQVDEDGVFQITGRRDIGIVRADGSDPRLVTDDVEFDWSPAWSEDGRKIVFSSNRGGPVGLWELDFDPETGEIGDTPRPIPAPSTYAGRLDAAKDGGSIVFVDGMGNVRMARIAIDLETLETTGLPEQIFAGGFGALFDVAADADRIVISGGPMRSDDLYVSRGDGSQVRQLTDDAFRYLEPRLHPDGRRILFFSNRSGDYEGWECDIDGGGYRMITDGWRLIDTPTVNPVDGTMATSTGEDWYLIPADAPTLKLSEAEPMPKIEGDRWFFPQQFSRDGTRILGLANEAGPLRPDGKARLAIHDMASGTYEVIERNLVQAPFSIDWAPDQRRIMLSNAKGIFVYDPDEDRLDTILELGVKESANVEFRVTTDGHLYYAVPEDERDIWIARKGTPASLTRFGTPDS